MKIEKLNSIKREAFSKKEAAYILSVSESTIDRMRKANEIAAVRIRGQVMFTRVELDRVLNY